MYSAKIAKYAPFLSNESDFQYKPLVFSCYGRVHPEATVIFNHLAQKAARKHGVIDYKGLLSRLHRNIGVEIWRRAASMVYECMPKLHDEERGFLAGCEPFFPLIAESDLTATVRPDAADTENPYPGSGRLNTPTLP